MAPSAVATMPIREGGKVAPPPGELRKHIRAQKVESSAPKSTPVFYRNIEEALDQRRAGGSLFPLTRSNWLSGDAVDMSSNDYLSWNSTGVIRKAFLQELADHPNFNVAAGGSRIMEGNYAYLEETEALIAKDHGAEAGLLVNSAFDANVMVWTALPRPGDAIVFDELVHASTHEGTEKSLAILKSAFPHNDLVAFRATLEKILDSQPMIKEGRRCILVAVESVYSMEGDVCPLVEMLDIADELSEGQGNIQFVVDETHSAGLIGPNGLGLVCELGLESDIAIRLHTYSKAMGACGGIILCTEMLKTSLINFARPTVYSAAPSFPFVAAIRAGHKLLGTPEATRGQQAVQSRAHMFFENLTGHPLWTEANKKGLLAVPLSEGWEERSFHTHIITVWTRQPYMYWLYMHLLAAGFFTLPVKHPVVPVGQGRLRVTFHAENTDAQMLEFVRQIYVWVQEIMDIENGKSQEKVTSAAKQVYAWMRQEGLKGFGMT